MAWTGAITNKGRELLTAWTGEAQLAFEGAQAGQGVVEISQLAAQTALTNKRQDGGIVGKETAESGVRLKIRFTAADEAYEMTQIGVLASVDSGDPVLLALFQQDEGIPIPSFADSPDFAYTFYALIVCSNTEDWEVRIDTSALATVGDVQEGMEAVLQECIPRTQLGQPYGAASLDGGGKLPATQLPAVIDCGVWDNTPPEKIVIHDANPLAHQNLLVDGNNAVGVDNSQTLEEHMTNPYAHQNLIVDGNNT